MTPIITIITTFPASQRAKAKVIITISQMKVMYVRNYRNSHTTVCRQP